MRLAFLALFLSCAAAADEVPLRQNFGTGEQIAIGAVVVTDAVLFGLQGVITDHMFGGTTQATCPRCLFGAPPGFDRDISDALWGGPGSKAFLGRVPDYTGNTIAPIATIGFYVGDSIVQWVRGHGFSGDVNATHKLLGFTEAYAIAMGLNQAVKITTGRLRPYYELGRTAPNKPVESDLSFFSGHTTSSFCIAGFVGRDLSDWMLREGANPWVARIVPNVVLYGAATVVGVSRIVDQAHYFSDVMLGAIVGGVIGNVVYAIHFDSHGHPRRRHGVDIVPVPGGVGLAGIF